ncbi:MAG: hypothetical protein A3J37_07175 [Alphaproteobacteria bacterium RIFCSPHIGHO2_12_FULL_45_9]|nr:MAG: hypothetical protein A3B66_04685 [Alphaproteobacteria bacterium RIFCSPHIGHO2_02_FULL_46_13]OFW95757.1 MAG: hypothetical protein A3J37_07175 [Alphaproteobacteria bacterium RIFCSPHIGHO2_12_FULL_45_9]
MKFLIFKLFISLIILAVALMGGVAYFGYTHFKTPSTNAVEKLVMVPKGSGIMMIADQLKAEQIISDSYTFIVASKILPPRDTIKAGEYQFQPHTSMSDVIAKLKKGETYKRKFTIAEGLTSYTILEKLKTVPDIGITEIEIPAEGSLLPDTYQYEKNETIVAIIARMQAAQKKLIEREWPNRDQNLPFTTIDQALTLASIVEKETGVAEERKRIAGVFVNRLRQGMPLQTDPTVIYALTNGQPQNGGQGPLGRRLLSKDLEIDSPYNTYKNIGLPPTPIANAGRDAILAVLHPEPNDFLYFVADGTGGHIFAKTLAEHNQNVANWRKIRSEQ